MKQFFKLLKSLLNRKLLYAIAGGSFCLSAINAEATETTPTLPFPWSAQPATKQQGLTTSAPNPFPWWQTKTKPKTPPNNPFGFWSRSKPQQSTLPFWSQPQTTRSNPYSGNPFSAWFGGSNQSRSVTTPNMFGFPGTGYGSGASTMFNPFSSMSMTNMMAPMMQGAMGFGTPFLMNYAIASVNPTTMTNFFNLMSQPQGTSPFGGFGGFPMMGFPLSTTPGYSTMPGYPATSRQNSAFNPFAFFNFNR